MLSIKTRYLYFQRIYLNQLSELRQSIKGQEMPEQLKSKALEIITQIQTGVMQVGDFTMSQLPDMVSSYIVFNMVWYWLMLALFAFALFCSAMLMRVAIKQTLNNDEAWLLIFVAFFPCFGSAVMVIIYTYKALFISIAPKVWLLMKLADMVSGK